MKKSLSKDHVEICEPEEWSMNKQSKVSRTSKKRKLESVVSSLSHRVRKTHKKVKRPEELKRSIRLRNFADLSTQIFNS